MADNRKISIIRNGKGCPVGQPFLYIGVYEFYNRMGADFIKLGTEFAVEVDLRLLENIIRLKNATNTHLFG